MSLTDPTHSTRAATAAHDTLARETLRLLGPAPDDWVPVLEGVDHDVVIVGGGQNGIALSFALQRAGIRKVAVIDAADGPETTGGWRTRARMLQLRTLKGLVGPELGLPTLGFRPWYESRHGLAAFDALERIPRLVWAAYLDWLREFLGVRVAYGTRLLDIGPGPAAAGKPLLRLTVEDVAGKRDLVVRHVILANGVAGSGAPSVPAVFEAARGAGLALHTADAIDPAALAGRRIAVIGSAASAFDAAAVALEAGARELHLFARRGHIPSTPVIRSRSYPGYYDHYLSLPDEERWRHAVNYRCLGSTPPADSIQRVLRFPNFHLHLSSTWTDLTLAEGGGVRGQVDEGGRNTAWDFDQVLLGTGYRVELALRPELATLAPQVLRWADRYAPPADWRDDELGLSPYLGSGLQLQAREPGTAPWLGQVHLVNPGGFASVGWPLGDVPCMRRDLPALVSHISRSLFQADWAHHQQRARVDPPADFGSDLYKAALWHPEATVAASPVPVLAPQLA